MRVKLSWVYLIASICCGVTMVFSGSPGIWFMLFIAFLWRSDFHTLSEQLLEIKERLDK